MTEKRYLVLPGRVRSRTDGDVHYVGAAQLMRLYRVDPKQCVIHRGERALGSSDTALIPLRPRYDGDYTLPQG